MKRFKTKKKFKKTKFLQIGFIVLTVYLAFSYSFNYLVKHKIKNKVTNKVLINYLLNAGTNNMLNKEDSLVNMNLNTSNFLLKTSLNDMIDDKAVILEDNYNEETIVTEYFEDPNNYEVKSPIIYIYNTHQLEEYSNSNVAVYDATPNVLMASYILKEKLNDLNIPTIVEQTDITNLLHINNWKYSYSYKASRILMEDAKTKNTSLKYFIDLHRDSLSKDKTTLTIENEDYAKMMFVVGVEHENYEKNLQLANKLSELINKRKNNLCKGVLEKGGEGSNGIYNQDVSENTLLIEMGGPENTIDEVTNSINIFADALYELIKGES